MSSFEALKHIQKMDGWSDAVEMAEPDLDPVSSAILERVRIRARLRIEWQRKIWAEERGNNTASFVSQAEVDAILDDRDNPGEESKWIELNSQFDPFRKRLAELEELIFSQQSRFTLLCRIFALTDQEADLLQMCYALQLDPALSRLYAFLQDNPVRGYATTELAQRLFGRGYAPEYHAESSLKIWQLITEHSVAPNEPVLLKIDPLVSEWLQGRNTLDAQLVEKSMLCDVVQPLESWRVEESLSAIQRFMGDDGQGRARVILSGPKGCGRTSFAAILAAKLGMTLLAIYTDTIHHDQWEQTFRCAQRQAFLDRTALCWKGEGLQELDWPRMITPYPLQFVALSPEQALPPQQGVVDHRIEIPQLTLSERQSLWRHYLPESRVWPEASFEQLVNQHQITVGEIAAVAAKRVTSFDEVQVCLRVQSQYRMGKLAQFMECPFTWNDMILSEYVKKALRDMLFEAGDRNLFWENPKTRRLFPQGRGLMGLFCGPPGTGKTMSAQVIAAELGMDLFRIDLASVVSKYVGETSKNLDRILSRAQHMDVVLLFDEADALLGRRTEIKDAHDRFANTDTNFLLQALEDYRGIAILSTNRKSNIDDAFLRRIRYVVEFPQPDSTQRALLWQRLLAEIAGDDVLAALKAEVDRLAAYIEMSGAQIKFSILGAVFAARRDKHAVNMGHLLRGINRELMKEGRVLSEHDKQRLRGS